MILIVVVCCLFGRSANAQTLNTNKLNPREAIKIVSHLTAGMREEEATRFLKKNGLKSWGSLGDSFCWADCVELTKPFCLALVITPKEFRTDGAWVNGLVQSASIQSNGVEVASIPLKKRP